VERTLAMRIRTTPPAAALRVLVDGRAADVVGRVRRMRLRTRALAPGRHVLVLRATAPGMRTAAARMRFRRCG
jgi:hypothetical protein